MTPEEIAASRELTELLSDGSRGDDLNWARGTRWCIPEPEGDSDIDAEEEEGFESEAFRRDYIAGRGAYLNTDHDPSWIALLQLVRQKWRGAIVRQPSVFETEWTIIESRSTGAIPTRETITTASTKRLAILRAAIRTLGEF
jgi:hypothetical protein